jgi:hypothetical protein
MTDIDLHSDLRIAYVDDDMTVVIPLVGEITKMWVRRYEGLARAKGLRAQILEVKGSGLIHLAVPVRTDGEDVLKTLDATRALIAEADAVDESPAASNSPEAIAKGWWARQKGLRPPGR